MLQREHLEQAGKTDDGKLILKGNCIITGKAVSVAVHPRDYERWKQGTYVQHAFPYLNPGEREFLISGCSGEAFDDLFEPPD